MSTPSEVDQQRAGFCAKALGLHGEYEITYLANTAFNYLLDPEIVIAQLDFDEYPYPNKDEIKSAIDESSVDVILPANFRLVGLSKKGDKTQPRIFGVVDVSPLL